MAANDCIVILFMISLCCGSELHPATETIYNDSQRSRSLAVEEQQPCPTWYRETKYNGVTRCVCGATIGIDVLCDDATKQTLLLAGFCMSYNNGINGTVIGACPFNYHLPDANGYYVTLPNDTSELNSFMCSGLN